MAYAPERFNENAGGMTGQGAFAVYDATGSPTQGGDSLDLSPPTGAGQVNTPGFFDGAEVRAAVARASQGKTAGEGLVVILQANNRLIMDVLYDNAGTLTLRGETAAAFRAARAA